MRPAELIAKRGISAPSRHAVFVYSRRKTGVRSKHRRTHKSVISTYRHPWLMQLFSGWSSPSRILKQSELSLYIRESVWNPNYNTLEPARQQHYHPAACVIAQQYSSATFIPLRFHFLKEKFGVFKNCYVFHLSNWVRLRLHMSGSVCIVLYSHLVL